MGSLVLPLFLVALHCSWLASGDILQAPDVSIKRRSAGWRDLQVIYSLTLLLTALGFPLFGLHDVPESGSPALS